MKMAKKPRKKTADSSSFVRMGIRERRMIWKGIIIRRRSVIMLDKPTT